MELARNFVVGMALVLGTSGCPVVGEEGSDLCDDQCVDQHLAYGIQWSVMSVFNAVTGQLGGVDTVVDCTHGGTAHVTGTVDGDVEEMLQADLVHELSQCEEARGDEYDLVLDGVVEQEGPFENGGWLIEFAYTSDEVTYDGTIRSDLTGDMQFADTCAMDTLLSCDSAGQCETTGTICGRALPALASTMADAI